jgi:hypothetical protein
MKKLMFGNASYKLLRIMYANCVLLYVLYLLYMLCINNEHMNINLNISHEVKSCIFDLPRYISLNIHYSIMINY